MKVGGNQLYHKQNDRLIRSVFKRGIISKVYVQQNTADVIVIGNTQTVIKNVPLSSNINPTMVLPNDKCRLDMFDETNPNDMVVAYIYGRSIKQYAPPLLGNGTATVTTSGIAVAHGLGKIPDFITIIKTTTPASTQSVSGGTGSYTADIDVYQYQASDATNFYLKSVIGTMTVNWTAVKFQ